MKRGNCLYVYRFIKDIVYNGVSKGKGKRKKNTKEKKKEIQEKHLS